MARRKRTARDKRPPAAAAAPARPQTRPRVRLFLAALLLVNVVVFARTSGFDFIQYDTPDQVSENAVVLQGLTLDGIRWAFTSGATGNWIPLSRLSHMLDVTLFGANAGPHQLMSAAIHAANALLLFYAVFLVTGYRWRSFLVALVFAIHPLHVESVAWINQRKDLLSAFFVLLGFLAYGRYARRPGIGRYAVLTGAYLCALLAKPMAVSFPVLLLLLDYWPLRRLPGTVAGGDERAYAPLRSYAAAVVEKVPLFLAAVGVTVISYQAQRAAGAMSDTSIITPTLRLTNAVVSYGIYVWQSIWPANLTVFYPMPATPQTAAAVAIGLGLLACAVVAFRVRTSRPYFTVGFLWFMLALAPVIGLIRVGLSAHADRYMYLAQTGLVVALVWWVADILRDRPQYQRAVAAVAAMACVGLTAAAWRQLGTWRNTTTVFEHALAVNPDNPVAHNALGLELRAAGKNDAAKEHYRAALAIWPGYAPAHNNLGEVLFAEDEIDDALAEFQAAIKSNPRLRPAQANLGMVLRNLGEPEAAAEAFRNAIAIRPGYGPSHMGLALALEAAGHNDEAVEETTIALQLAPGDAELEGAARRLLRRLDRLDVVKAVLGNVLNQDAGDLHYAQGNALVAQGRYEEAIAEFRAAIEAGNKDAQVYANLGAAQASIGRYQRAVKNLSEALRLDPSLTEVERNLQLVQELIKDGGSGRTGGGQ